MRASHFAGCRVCWRYAHPRNFAEKALRLGYDKRAIVDAWRRAVWQSHEDSLDVDVAPAGRDVPLREPSCAVVYAWRILWADRRTAEERWAAITAAPRVKLPAVKLPREKRAPAAVAKVAAPSDSMPAEKVAEMRTFEAALKARGLTTPALMALPPEERQRIGREIAEELRRKSSR